MKFNPFFITGIFIVTSAGAYSVKKGDSLSAISKQHYGSWNKWPELWESNKPLIQNPNLIFPGQKLQIPNAAEVLATSRESSPLLASNSQNVNYKTLNKSRSQEWRMLPEQTWEKFVFKTSPDIDPDGFDRRSRIAKRVPEKTTPTFAIASDRIPIEGEIINARTEYDQIFLGEQIFIRAEEQLQVGKVYSITNAPEKISSKRDGRVGFAYELSAKVKIIGVRDGMFIGTLIATQKPVLRKSLLIPEVPLLQFTKPVASSGIIPANIITTDFQQNSLISEQHLVILDAGSNDGVKKGMIFRRYLKKDPNTDTVITTKDYIIETDLQVLDVKDQFSIAIVLQTHSVLRSGEEVLSLADLKDFNKNSGMQTIIQDDAVGAPLNDLDQFEDNEGLGIKEDQELRQLEKVQLNETPTPSTVGNEIAPNDQLDAKPEKTDQPATAPTEEIPDSVLDVDSDLDAPTESAPSESAPTVDATVPQEIPQDMSADLDALSPPESTPAPDASPIPSPSPSPKK